jgi:hypothetical protein
MLSQYQFLITQKKLFWEKFSILNSTFSNNENQTCAHCESFTPLYIMLLEIVKSSITVGVAKMHNLEVHSIDLQTIFCVQVKSAQLTTPSPLDFT